jgi:DNA/RNA-binding domain of Phe-tRNA-synthetase-like protein
VFSITVDPQVKQAIPTLRLGLLEATNVANRAQDAALRTMLLELEESLRHTWGAKGAANHPQIAATRRAYRALRDDPTRYRPANEALLRRTLTRRALPQINVVVDINTFVSLQSGFALGCYDVAALQPPFTVRSGQPGETYAPIGKTSVDAANRLVLADQPGIFGSPTADAERSLVATNTQHVLFVVFAFEAPAAAVERALHQIATLLTQFCNATIVGQDVLTATQEQTEVLNAGTS